MKAPKAIQTIHHSLTSKFDGTESMDSMEKIDSKQWNSINLLTLNSIHKRDLPLENLVKAEFEICSLSIPSCLSKLFPQAEQNLNFVLPSFLGGNTRSIATAKILRD